jgi:hypothetical protein
MYLGNPLLPIKESLASAEQLVRKQLEKKSWLEYEIKPLVLELVPFFLFNYHYYIENPGPGKSIVKNTIHGILVINGHSIEVREDLVDLIKHSWKKAVPEVPRGEFEEKWCNIDKREQDEVLKMQTAKYFNIPKDNVVVSSARKLFVPRYRTEAVIEGKKFPLLIYAIDGSIEGIKSVPEREKGYLELTRETIFELKKPKNWINYSKEAIMDIFSSKPESKSESKEKKSFISAIDFGFLESRGFLLLLMLLALLLIIASIFRIKF